MTNFCILLILSHVCALYIYIKLATSKNINRKSMFKIAIYYSVKNVRQRYENHLQENRVIESRSSIMENITETCCRIRDKGL